MLFAKRSSIHKPLTIDASAPVKKKVAVSHSVIVAVWEVFFSSGPGDQHLRPPGHQVPSWHNKLAKGGDGKSDTMGSDSMILERLFLELNGYTRTISSFLSIHQNLGGSDQDLGIIYNVQTPNQLWHIDGNHKLVRWRMVFHGCCLNNNRASSVLELFRTGIQSFGLPLRIRCDHSMENTAVARYMLERRGLNKGSVITGRSVHNQRIERLWAELNRVVSFHYSSLFTFMENEGILDSTDELHLFSAEFRNQWNNHGLSTEEGQTPLKLCQRGVLNRAGAGNLAIDYIFTGSETFDINEGIPPQLETANNIVVPVNEFNVNETVLNRIQETVDPLRDDGNHGIELFLGLVNFLSELYQS
ncbi:hypothetical protein Q5P01_016524 [Channa striata]|uniref:Integrase core domain-containing protein n=1 Tax=Channa striata TaxID=64152 RepID=A0AA88MEC5_CHASR|nr:hypothetical protein Q5P01_016524 [Channa striata]